MISLALKMWKVSDNVGRVLEYVGMAEKNDPLLDYAYMIGMVSVFFLALELCMVVNNCLTIMCRSIGETVLMTVSNFLSTFVPRREPLVYPVEVLPWAESFEPPSDESQADVEGVVKRAEEICEECNQDIPQEYLCPIGLTVMVTPVTTLTGHTFDFTNLQMWFQHNDTCPCTRKPTIIASRNLIVEHIIQKWAKDVIDKRVEDVLTPAPATQVVHTHVSPVIVQESTSNVEIHRLFGSSHASVRFQESMSNVETHRFAGFSQVLVRFRAREADSDWDHDSLDDWD